MLPPPRHFPGVARRDRRARLRPRRQTLPLPRRLPSRPRPHLRRLRLRPRLRVMAAHRFRGRQHDRAGFRERECEEWGWHGGHDIGLVRVRVADYRDDWFARYDSEYQSVGSLDG